MSDFVKEENVFVGQSAQSREEVLRFLADRAGELGITPIPMPSTRRSSSARTWARRA